MEEEGTEDNGLEEDSRDGQVWGVHGRGASRSSVTSRPVADAVRSLGRRMRTQGPTACRASA